MNFAPPPPPPPPPVIKFTLANNLHTCMCITVDTLYSEHPWRVPSVLINLHIHVC